MNWTTILADNGIPESPGRPQAVAATHAAINARKAAAEEQRKQKGKKK
jgi:hypothetical protein